MRPIMGVRPMQAYGILWTANSVSAAATADVPMSQRPPALRTHTLAEGVPVDCQDGYEERGRVVGPQCVLALRCCSGIINPNHSRPASVHEAVCDTGPRAPPTKVHDHEVYVPGGREADAGGCPDSLDGADRPDAHFAGRQVVAADGAEAAPRGDGPPLGGRLDNVWDMYNVLKGGLFDNAAPPVMDRLYTCKRQLVVQATSLLPAAARPPAVAQGAVQRARRALARWQGMQQARINAHHA